MSNKYFHFWLLTLGLLLFTNSGFSQPFSNVQFGIGYHNTSQMVKSYSSRWDLSNSISVSARTPFYVGDIGLSLNYFDYIPKENSGQIKSINYSLSIGHSFNLIKDRLHFYLAAGTGIQKTTILSNNFTERELFYLAKLEPSFNFKNLIFFGSFEFRKIFNYERQHLLMYGGGLRVRLFLPEKIQEFIK